MGLNFAAIFGRTCCGGSSNRLSACRGLTGLLLAISGAAAIFFPALIPALAYHL